jgi:cell division septum initiation protein DivIVA
MTDETLRRSDELLTELIETIETARALPMSASCVLPRERLLDLLDELREVLPPEMDEARTIVATRQRLIKEGYERSSAMREKAVAEADTVLSDAGHRAEQIIAEAQQAALDTVAAGRAEHDALVSNTAVHQAAAQAAATLRTEAEDYHAEVSAKAQEYDAKVRAEADRYAHDARAEAERYSTKLTADAENYAERTLDELSAVLHRAATTAEQGRSAVAARRASEWTAATLSTESLTTEQPHEEPAPAEEFLGHQDSPRKSA